jgi:hypothetical protein
MKMLLVDRRVRVVFLAVYFDGGVLDSFEVAVVFGDGFADEGHASGEGGWSRGFLAVRRRDCSPAGEGVLVRSCYGVLGVVAGGRLDVLRCVVAAALEVGGLDRVFFFLGDELGLGH